MSTPATTESAPSSAGTHSPVSSRRSRTAATISSTPVTIAQTPASRTSTRAVTAGHSAANTPATIPTTPARTYDHRRPRPPRDRPLTAIPTPSTTAYAAKRSASASTVTPGHTSVSTPKSRARTPRRASRADRLRRGSPSVKVAPAAGSRPSAAVFPCIRTVFSRIRDISPTSRKPSQRWGSRQPETLWGAGYRFEHDVRGLRLFSHRSGLGAFVASPPRRRTPHVHPTHSAGRGTSAGLPILEPVAGGDGRSATQRLLREAAVRLPVGGGEAAVVGEAPASRDRRHLVGPPGV